ncbi:MAG: DNA polymerase III subunit gamma/tau [Hydrogenobaculum sp.]
MSYIPFARKYRPKTFKELIGQEIPATILKNAFLYSKIHHAYIFAGHKGTGKTTTARIFAKVLNCLNPQEGEPCNSCQNCQAIEKGTFVDLIEMDAASNRGIDEIRAIKEGASYLPMQGKYKVYIIDEAHMLTKEAFNALLKTIEEPPPSLIFILCTTEFDKILPTIQSRCQKLIFSKASKENIKTYLKRIATEENLEIDEEALDVIADLSDDSMRDAASLLDQASTYGNNKVTIDTVKAMFGPVDKASIRKFLELLIEGDTRKTIDMLNTINEKGYNVRLFWEGVYKELKNILKAFATGEAQEEFYKNMLSKPLEVFLYLEDIVNQGFSAMYQKDPILALEITVLKASLIKDFVPISELLKEGLDLPAKPAEKKTLNEPPKDDLTKSSQNQEKQNEYPEEVEKILEVFKPAKILHYEKK